MGDASSDCYCRAYLGAAPNVDARGDRNAWHSVDSRSYCYTPANGYAAVDASAQTNLDTASYAYGQTDTHAPGNSDASACCHGSGGGSKVHWNYRELPR